MATKPKAGTHEAEDGPEVKTPTGGPANLGGLDPIPPGEGGAAVDPEAPEKSLYRPAQKQVMGEIAAEVAPPLVNRPYGSEPRSYDPKTGEFNPDYQPIHEEDHRSPEQVAEFQMTGKEKAEQERVTAETTRKAEEVQQRDAKARQEREAATAQQTRRS